MKVLDSDLCAIVLSLFQELDLQPGECVGLETLGDHWREVGLRRFDLESAIGMLLRDGYIERDASSKPPHTYRLTDDGYAQMRKVGSLFAFYFSHHQHIRRLAARRRAVHAHAADAGRSGQRRHND